MNTLMGIGIVKRLEAKTSKTGKAFATFVMQMQNKGQTDTFFLNCITWITPVKLAERGVQNDVCCVIKGTFGANKFTDEFGQTNVRFQCSVETIETLDSIMTDPVKAGALNDFAAEPFTPKNMEPAIDKNDTEKIPF